MGIQPEETEAALRSLALLVCILLLLGACFGVLSAIARARIGSRAVWMLWGIGAVLLGLGAAFRLAAQQRALGFPPAAAAISWPKVLGAIYVSACVLGVAALATWRRRLPPSDVVGTVTLGALGAFGGLLLALLPVAVLDVGRLW